MKDSVILSKRAVSDLQKVPKHVVVKLKSWVDLVESSGLLNARKVPGYHDEPLKASRLGQRSIRLSRSYRAFYTVEFANVSVRVVVHEVNKHDY